MEDGDWLVGLGCAAAAYPTNIAATAARVTLRPDGHARVQIAAHDIGTGAYTVIAITAADRLGQRRALTADRELDDDPAAAREVDAGGELVHERVAAVVRLGEQPADPGRLDEAGPPDGGVSVIELAAGQSGQ